VRALNYLELAGPLERSGIETSVRHQRQALADAGLEVVTSPWAGGRPVSGLQSTVAGGPLLADVDVVHCNLIGPGTVAVAETARSRDVPLVLHAHVTGEDFRESFRGSTEVAPLLQRYLRWFYSRADLLLCPSEYTRRVLETYPVEARIEAITNGVDLDALAGFERFREEYRRRYGLDGFVPFTVGSVFERKGLTTFCRLARRTDYQFAWFGTYDTGPQASPTVRRWTNDPPENVTFTGWVEDVRGAYAAGDVFCFPSKTENQGIVVLEAMACRKPVVIRDIPVFEEFYTHGEDCLKCETVAEFADALAELEANPDLRERLGENGRATAAEHGLDRVGERLREHYESLL